MHLLTSALFIPSYMAVLDEPQRRAILQSYALTLFQVLLVRGRPHIFPKDVMRRPDQPTSGAPLAPRAPELPHAEGRLDALGDTAAPEEQNPWLEIVANAIVYRGEYSLTS